MPAVQMLDSLLSYEFWDTETEIKRIGFLPPTRQHDGADEVGVEGTPLSHRPGDYGGSCGSERELEQPKDQALVRQPVCPIAHAREAVSSSKCQLEPYQQVRYGTYDWREQ